MVDLDTICFIGLLNEYARKSQSGIRPFSEATWDDHKGIFYDETTSYSDNSCVYHPVITSFLVTREMRELVHKYDLSDMHSGTPSFCVVFDPACDAPYVGAYDPNRGIFVAIEHGMWRVV